LVNAGAIWLRQNCSQTPPKVGTIRVFPWADALIGNSEEPAAAAIDARS
jgi:hypothetical protein